MSCALVSRRAASDRFASVPDSGVSSRPSCRGPAARERSLPGAKPTVPRRHRKVLIGLMAVACVMTTAGEALGQRWAPDRQAARASKNIAPTAHAGGNVSGVVGEHIKLDGSRSYDPQGWITEYAWDFGDGSTGRGRVTSHVYDAAGAYTVTLRVTDNGPGIPLTDESTAIVTVNPSPGSEELRADFRIEKLVYVDPVSGDEEWEPVGMSADDPIEYGLRVRLNAEDWSAGAAYYLWDRDGAGFGDYAGVQFRTYIGPDEFNVSLTVYDASAQDTDTITRTIYVDAGMESLSIMPWQEDGARPISFTVEGTHLWAVTLSGKLGVVDLSNPYDLPRMEIVATDNIDDSDVLATSEGRLFVARQDAGVDVYSADPQGFSLLGSLSPGDLDADGAAFVGGVGSTLYVGTIMPYELQVYDVSELDVTRSPTAPTYKSAMPIENGLVAGWQIGDGVLIVRNSALTLTLVDIRDPLNPHIETVLDPAASWITRAGVAGNLAYVLAPEGLKIWEIVVPSNRAEPISAVPRFSFDELAIPLGVAANRLYLQHMGAIKKYDIADPSAPYQMDLFNPNGEGSYGGFTYVPLDPTLPQHPILIVGTNTSSFESVLP